MAQDYLVAGMTCGGCARSVEKAIRRAAPDAEVTVDLENARVSIAGAFEESRIAEAIDAAGFEFRGRA
jgi:copper chaperone